MRYQTALKGQKQCFIFVALCALLCTSCNQHGQQNSKDPCEEVSNEMEVLNRDSLKLNNQLSFTSSKLEIREALGEPDSITFPGYECGSYVDEDLPKGDTISIWHYGNSQFITYGDFADIKIINFSDDDFRLSYSQGKLSSASSLQSLKDVFPNAVCKVVEDSTSIKVFQKISLLPKPNWDDYWWLYFSNDSLIEIHYWTPC